MKNKYLILFLVFSLFLLGLLFSEADEFYLDLFSSGKNNFKLKNFSEAINDFAIAEFGLYENRDVYMQISFYKLAAFYILNDINGVKKTIKDLFKEFKPSEVNPAVLPARFRPEVQILLELFQRFDSKGISLAWLKKQVPFELKFKTVNSLLKTMPPDAIAKNIKQLEKINKSENRLIFLEAVLYYKKKKYEKCINNLNKFVLADKTKRLTDQVLYYQALSYYHLQNHKKFLELVEKINNPEIKSLVDKIKKNAEKN